MNTDICIEAQSRGQSDRQIRKGTHQGGSKCGDGGGGGDEVALYLSHAGRVLRVSETAVAGGADAGSSRVLEDGGIDGDLERVVWVERGVHVSV